MPSNSSARKMNRTRRRRRTSTPTTMMCSQMRPVVVEVGTVRDPPVAVSSELDRRLIYTDAIQTIVDETINGAIHRMYRLHRVRTVSITIMRDRAKLCALLAPPKRSNPRKRIVVRINLSIIAALLLDSNDRYRRRSRSRSPVRRSPPSSTRSGEFLVKMRGMPYTVVEDQIRKVQLNRSRLFVRDDDVHVSSFVQFFPSSCPPARIEILQDRRMHRSNGDAHIFFNSLEDANEAMKCDRKYMGKQSPT